MANLHSHVERWQTKEPRTLIYDASKGNSNWNLAQRTVEAVTPSLMKMGEGWLSETGDIQVFLYLALEPETKKVLCAIAEYDENQEMKPRVVVYDQEAQDLAASFLCDFPNALFSVEGGFPIVMMVQVPAKSTVPGFVPGEHVNRFVTLNNMLEMTQNKWYNMIIKVPGGKKNAAPAEGCGKFQQLQLKNEGSGGGSGGL